jgi:nucleoside 2-deoxyribosyltransferase
MGETKSFTVYFAGELFSLKHLAGNALLADAIHQVSEGRYACTLPQAKEQRDLTAKDIRDEDIKMLMQSDVGIFHFDGPEPDMGTVVEYMIAKFLDIPSVIVRSDFRAGGDSGVDPWNLMASFYPRTENVIVNGIALFQKHMSSASKGSIEIASDAVKASIAASKEAATEVVKALDSVVAQPPCMSADHVESVYGWMQTMPGEHFSNFVSEESLKELLLRKRKLGLINKGE